MQRLVEFFLHLGHNSILGLFRSCVPRSQANALYTDFFKCTRCIIRIVAGHTESWVRNIGASRILFHWRLLLPQRLTTSFRRFPIHRGAHHWCSFADY